MNYFKLINTLKEVLEEDSRIKTVTEGDIDNLDEWKQSIPGIAHIIVSGGTINDNLNVYDVLLQCVDRVDENNNPTTEKFKGNFNLQEVYNDMDDVIRRTFLKFRKRGEDDNITIVNGASFEKIDERETQNRMAGWSANFQVEVPNLIMDICVDP